MSRLFNDAASESLNADGAPVAAAPLGISAWAYFNDLTAICTVICLGDASLNKHYFSIDMAGSVANDPVRCIAQAGTPQGVCSLPSAITVNTWHHLAALFLNSTSRYVYVDNVASAENTDSSIPSGLDEVAIGELLYTVRTNFMSGMIAEPAVWDLTDWGANDAERKTAFETAITQLALGEAPDSYPTGLEGYWSFRTSSLEDEADDFDLTATGTTFSLDHPSMRYNLVGSVAGVSDVTGNTKSTEKLKVLVEAQSGVTGNLQWFQELELAGLIEAQSGVTGNLQWLQELAGLIEAQSGLTGNIDSILVYSLAGSLAGLSGVTGNILSTEILIGSITGLSGVTGNIFSTETLAGSLAGLSSVVGNLQWLQELAGLVEAQSGLTGELTVAYISIPPFMEKDLIDPYASGAWLWLCQIAVPGYDTQRIARNTEDVGYVGRNFTKANIQIGKQAFAGDGSIPRIMLRVGQDPDRVIEDIVNESEGCYNGTVKLIRVNEKWLTSSVKALEADYGMLVAESDWEWVYFTLGIPNPLTQRIPLRIGSSKICPWAIPELFKGVECQYEGELTNCTGTIEDCRDNKDNAVHWGGELGLDPNVTRV